MRVSLVEIDQYKHAILVNGVVSSLHIQRHGGQEQWKVYQGNQFLCDTRMFSKDNAIVSVTGIFEGMKVAEELA